MTGPPSNAETCAAHWEGVRSLMQWARRNLCTESVKLVRSFATTPRDLRRAEAVSKSRYSSGWHQNKDGDKLVSMDVVRLGRP